MTNAQHRASDDSIRDEAATGFTPILARAVETVPTAVAAAFLDFEGECIDYWSLLDPHDTKVIAAQTQVILVAAGRATRRLAWGDAVGMELETPHYTLVIRRVDRGHVLVIVCGPSPQEATCFETLQTVVEALSAEAGLVLNVPSGTCCTVELRPATGWPYAPQAFIENGRRTALTHVLGRWVEPSGNVCFRARTEQGQELTLVHEVALRRWQRKS